MKEFLLDLIPKLQQYSKKLDHLTLLENQHWVLLNECHLGKTVYIFRANNDLLLSKDGKVEKAKWEYLGNETLLIDRKDESLLFKHAFFDETVLALKIDGRDEFAVLVNESKYDGELNSLESIIRFLESRYIDPKTKLPLNKKTHLEGAGKKWTSRESNKGELQIEIDEDCNFYTIEVGQRVLLNGKPAPTGVYWLGFLHYVNIVDGVVSRY